MDIIKKIADKIKQKQCIILKMMDKVYKNDEIARKNVKFITNTPSKHGINVMFLKK